jgi:hypothetical protein
MLDPKSPRHIRRRAAQAILVRAVGPPPTTHLVVVRERDTTLAGPSPVDNFVKTLEKFSQQRMELDAREAEARRKADALGIPLPPLPRSMP